MAAGDLYNQWQSQMGGHQINTKVNTAQTDAPKLNWIQRNLNSIGGGAGATGGAMGGAAIGTAILPGLGTIGGGLIGALLGGGAGGALGEAAKQSAEGNAGSAQARNEIVKQAGIQGGLSLAGEGAGQLIGHALAPAAKVAADEGGGLLSKFGNGLREDVMNPVVKASPFGAAQESEIATKANKLLPVGSASAKYSAMPKTMEALGNQLDTVLAKNTASGVTVPAHDITTAITNTLSDATKFPTTDAGFAKAADQHIANILHAGAQNGGDLSATNIANLRRGLQDAAFKGSTMTPQKEAAQAVWQHLGDVLQQVAPEAKSIITDQGVLFKAAPGLAKAADKTIGIPLVGIKSRTAERAVQAGKDVVGAALDGSGPIGKAVSGVKDAVGAVAPQTVPRLAVGASEALNNPQSADAQATDTQPTVTDSAQPTDTSSPAQQGIDYHALMLQDLKTGGHNLAKLQQMQAIDKAANAGGQLSATQQKGVDDAKYASGLLDTMLTQLSQTGGAQGRAGGIVSGLLGKVGLNSDVNAYNQTKTDAAIALGKALTGAARVPESVIKALEASLPSVSDNPEEAQRKVQLIQQRLQGRINPGGQ